ncbi:Mfa1 family fimbria major subunit [Parapedobacter deserti]|uniref:Mfa1 family fimbria major subunit n=1 Tax=Parapedobacter deserti TaxID=1912957 RepID=A0ABV7JJZ3_9SPHI
MKIKQLLTIALVGLVLGACKRPGGDDRDTVVPEGKIVKAKLAVSIPKNIRTYAPGDGDLYATPEEIYAEYLDVFIYENGGSYAVDHFHFVRTGPTPADFISANDPGEGEFKNPGNSSTFVTGEFEVKQGDKLVYVGVNLPDLIVHRLRTGYYVNEVFEDEDLLAELLSGTPSAGGASRVAYFSATRGTNVTFDDVTTINPIATPISVSRLVAKVVVTTDGGPGSLVFDNVSGGTVTNFEFAIGQRNNQMYVAPLLGTPGEDPNHAANTIHSVGALSINSIRKLRNVSDVEFKAINDLLVVGNGDFQDPAANIHYTTENTSVSHRHQDVTYVSVRAQFIPHKLGWDPITGDATTYNNSVLPELYAVFTGDNTGGEDALGARYFDNLGAAREFVMSEYFENLVNGGVDITFNESGVPVDTDPINTPYDVNARIGGDHEADHYIFYYPNSYCYYRIYLNPNGNGPSGPGTTNLYDILRNTVYVANITGVNYIGTTNPDAIPGGYENGALSAADVTLQPSGTYRGTPIYPGDWFPNILTGTPLHPEHVIDPTPTATGLNVTVSMENWDSDEDEYELN